MSSDSISDRLALCSQPFSPVPRFKYPFGIPPGSTKIVFVLGAGSRGGVNEFSDKSAGVTSWRAFGRQLTTPGGLVIACQSHVSSPERDLHNASRDAKL